MIRPVITENFRALFNLYSFRFASRIILFMEAIRILKGFLLLEIHRLLRDSAWARNSLLFLFAFGFSENQFSFFANGFTQNLIVRFFSRSLNLRILGWWILCLKHLSSHFLGVFLHLWLRLFSRHGFYPLGSIKTVIDEFFRAILRNVSEIAVHRQVNFVYVDWILALTFLIIL